MKILQGDVWKRIGMSLLWGGETLSVLAQPRSVVTIRQFFALVGSWPDELPCNGGDTLVVAGLEGCIDLLAPADAESWLKSELLPAILDFQDKYEGQAALVFWMPTGKNRVKMNPATEEYFWVCSAPHSTERLELGRILWAGAKTDVARIMDPNCQNKDPDGPAWIGLRHLRLS